jgi:hypothetical protein
MGNCAQFYVLYLKKKQRNYFTVEKEQENAAVATDIGEMAE